MLIDLLVIFLLCYYAAVSITAINKPTQARLLRKAASNADKHAREAERQVADGMRYSIGSALIATLYLAGSIKLMFDFVHDYAH